MFLCLCVSSLAIHVCQCVCLRVFVDTHLQMCVHNWFCVCVYVGWWCGGLCECWCLCVFVCVCVCVRVGSTPALGGKASVRRADTQQVLLSHSAARVYIDRLEVVVVVAGSQCLSP